MQVSICVYLLRSSIHKLREFHDIISAYNNTIYKNIEPESRNNFKILFFQNNSNVLYIKVHIYQSINYFICFNKNKENNFYKSLNNKYSLQINTVIRRSTPQGMVVLLQSKHQYCCHKGRLGHSLAEHLPCNVSQLDLSQF